MGSRWYGESAHRRRRVVTSLFFIFAGLAALTAGVLSAEFPAPSATAIAQVSPTAAPPTHTPTSPPDTPTPEPSHTPTATSTPVPDTPTPLPTREATPTPSPTRPPAQPEATAVGPGGGGIGGPVDPGQAATATALAQASPAATSAPGAGTPEAALTPGATPGKEGPDTLPVSGDSPPPQTWYFLVGFLLLLIGAGLMATTAERPAGLE